MSDQLMEKVSALGERLKTTGAEVSRKMTASLSSMSFKVKELLDGRPTTTTTTATAAERLVEEATTSLEEDEEPKWSLNLHICDLINHKRLDGGDVVRSVKKRLVLSRCSCWPRVQYLCMVLVEMLVGNCEKAVADEVTSEGVVDELVKLSGDRSTVCRNRDKALMLIKDWRESCCEMQYLLYTHEQNYKRLQSRVAIADTKGTKSSASNPNISSDESSPIKDLGSMLQLTDQYDNKIRKQILEIARNSMELLSTVISSSSSSSSPYPSDQEDLATALAEQCRRSQYEVQRMITAKKGDDDDDWVFEEALRVNDHLHSILSKYEDHLQGRRPDDQQSSVAAVSPDHQGVDDDLDEMIFGNKNNKRIAEDHGEKADDT